MRAKNWPGVAKNVATVGTTLAVATGGVVAKATTLVQRMPIGTGVVALVGSMAALAARGVHTVSRRDWVNLASRCLTAAMRDPIWAREAYMQT